MQLISFLLFLTHGVKSDALSIHSSHPARRTNHSAEGSAAHSSGMKESQWHAGNGSLKFRRGITVTSQKPTHVFALSQSAPRMPSVTANVLAASALEQQHVNLMRKGHKVLMRPNAGRGVDKVNFSMIAKNFFGAELKLNRFTIDIVLSLQWHDPRVVGFIPDGLDELTMAWRQAIELIWMPGIVVANRDIEMYEIISASVTIFRSGEVLRVERAQARCMKKYMLEQYPFDKQDIHVEIVSSKYMSDEVVLTPSSNESGVLEHIWGLYKLQSWAVETYDEHDGDLRKSRGQLVMSLQRTLGKYFDDHLVPCAIVLTISWAVFYFPFGTNPFITPRLALSILALLTFTNLMVKSSKELPGSAPFNWNDLLNQQIQILMFVTIVLNIASEICFHQWGQEWLARKMNNEAKALLPISSLFNICIILGSGKYGWMGLRTATFLTKGLLSAVLFGYTFYVGYTVYKKNIKGGGSAESMAAAAAADEGADADGDGGDGEADCGCD